MATVLASDSKEVRSEPSIQRLVSDEHVDEDSVKEPQTVVASAGKYRSSNSASWAATSSELMRTTLCMHWQQTETDFRTISPVSGAMRHKFLRIRHLEQTARAQRRHRFGNESEWNPFWHTEQLALDAGSWASAFDGGLLLNIQVSFLIWPQSTFLHAETVISASDAIARLGLMSPKGSMKPDMNMSTMPRSCCRYSPQKDT